jgi:hypothetical protein
MGCRNRQGLTTVKVSVADVRVEHEVNLNGFYKVAGQEGRITMRWVIKAPVEDLEEVVFVRITPSGR